METKTPSVDVPGSLQRTAGGELPQHEQRVVDYALGAVNGAMRANTEELVARNRQVVNSEINKAFEQYSRMTTGRRLMLAVGGLAAFGLGFLIKGWIGTPVQEEPVSNGVHPE